MVLLQKKGEVNVKMESNDHDDKCCGSCGFSRMIEQQKWIPYPFIPRVFCSIYNRNKIRDDLCNPEVWCNLAHQTCISCEKELVCAILKYGLTAKERKKSGCEEWKMR